MVTLDSVAATGLNMGAEGSKASSDPLLNLSTLIHTSSGGHFFFFFLLIIPQTILFIFLLG